MTAAKTKGRPKASGATKGMLLTVRCSAPYLAWVNSYAAAREVDAAKLVEEGLALLAMAHKYEPPPPR